MPDGAAQLPESKPAVPSAQREVRFRYSGEFIALLNSLSVSLLVSTYQAGKLVTIGADDSGLNLSLHNFEQAMGIAVHPRRIAVGSRDAVWLLQNTSELAPRLATPKKHDACYLTRQSFVTGNIHGHEVTWVGDELWIVNTLFSCLATLHDNFSFVPRWRPPFITELEATDRCHLNGLALDKGHPKYVTCMADSNEPDGWRAGKADSGRVLDIDSGEVVTQGLAMPHSPRVYRGQLWILNSGRGSLESVDAHTGEREVVAMLPGYTRGLAFYAQFAFVGMSRIRETAVFGGVPIAEKRHELRCAVIIVDLSSGRPVAFLEFEKGVEEIFDVQVLPRARNVSITGPYPALDDAQDVWIVPPLGAIPNSSGKPGRL